MEKEINEIKKTQNAHTFLLSVTVGLLIFIAFIKD